MTRSTLAALLGGTALIAAGPATARSRWVQPYVELTQVATADLSNGDDAVTYTQVAAGVDRG